MSGATAGEKLPARTGAAIGAACGLIVAVAGFLGWFHSIDLRLQDGFDHRRGPVTASDRIAVVEIDDQFLRAKDIIWPLPREYYAMAIDALETAGAQAIGIDVLFLGDIAKDPTGDALLASMAHAHDNLVLGINFARNDGSLSAAFGASADSIDLIRHGRPVTRQRFATAQSVALPYADLLANAHDLGHLMVLIDKDGVVRRIPQFVRYGDWVYPSIVMRLVEVAARSDSTLPQFELESEGVAIHWRGRTMEVPCDKEGATSIAFAGDEGAFPHRYSMLQLLQWYRDGDSTAIARAFRGKLVLIGVTSTQEHANDIGPTPYSDSAPLVYIHANAVNAAILGRFQRFVPPVWILVSLIMLGVGLGLLYSRLTVLHAGLVALGALLVVGALCYGLFLYGDVDIPPLGALLVPPITYIAVENAWRRKAEHHARVRARELDVARSIQEHLLPSKPPKHAGLDIAGRNIPADSIGGDYFDWVELDDDSIAVVVGDISGHGIPAAILMAHLRASFHAEVKPGRSPEDIVATVNNSLARAAAPGKFATFFLGVISVGEKKLRYCNAGHNSPLLLRAGEVRELGATGVPLAVMEDMFYTGGEESFEAGDTLVIYSDGIPEAPQRNQPKLFYGDERLREQALALAKSEPDSKAIVEKLLADVKQVAGERMSVDDVTLVVVRRT